MPLMTAADLATYLNVSRATIYNLMKRGMPSVKIGRARRFRLPDVERWLDGNTDDWSAALEQLLADPPRR